MVINKVLIIGIGSIAKKHVEALRALYKNVDVYGFRSSRASKKVEGIKDVYDLKELDFSPDFVIISNPTFKHYEAIEACIRLEIPLFIEKPLLSSLENGEELINKLSKTNTKTYVACNLRFHPVLRRIKNKIKEDKLNVEEVNIYCGSYLPEWRQGIDYKKNYSAISAKGGGVHLDLIHEIDYCYWIFGPPLETHKVLRSNSHLDIDSVDYANYTLIYEKFVITIVLNYFRKTPKRQIEIVSKESILVGDIINNSLTSTGATERFDPVNTYEEQLKYFVSTVNSSNKIMNTAKEALEVLKITLV